RCLQYYGLPAAPQLHLERPDRLGREIASRQLLARIDVRCCDSSLQYRRIADRSELELPLGDRGYDEDVLLGDGGPGSSLRDQPFRDENRHRLGRALDAAAVVTQVDEQEDRRQDRRRDPNHDRPLPGLQQTAWRKIFHVCSPPISFLRSFSRFLKRRFGGLYRAPS